MGRRVRHISTSARPARRWANPERLIPRDRATEVTALSGCVALIDRELFRRLGGFDPRYFTYGEYGEHIDLGLRARAAGARPIYDPAASVLHADGASATVAAKPVMVLRARSTLVHRHWSPGRARTAIALLRCGVAARALGTVALRRLGRGDETWIEAWRQRSAWSAGWSQQHPSVTAAGQRQLGGGTSAKAARVRSA
jgi:N-acetylglucosaminyl-diphospho-decaprenol L-rhamnosyltransferase